MPPRQRVQSCSRHYISSSTLASICLIHSLSWQSLSNPWCVDSKPRIPDTETSGLLILRKKISITRDGSKFSECFLMNVEEHSLLELQNHRQQSWGELLQRLCEDYFQISSIGDVKEVNLFSFQLSFNVKASKSIQSTPSFSPRVALNHVIDSPVNSTRSFVELQIVEVDFDSPSCFHVQAADHGSSLSFLKKHGPFHQIWVPCVEGT